MKNVLFALFAVSLLAFGCVQPGGPSGAGANASSLQQNVTQQQNATQPQQNTTPPVQPGAAAGAAAGQQNQNASAGAPPRCVNGMCSGGPPMACRSDADCAAIAIPHAPQVECATMSPDCGSCVAKPGCGWCKSSNSCLAGSAGGPASGQCPANDWAASQVECAGPSGGSSCSQQTNCATCLTGSGCKWCIQGSICADASNPGRCLGGWMNQSYQCNLATR